MIYRSSVWVWNLGASSHFLPAAFVRLSLQRRLFMKCLNPMENAQLRLRQNGLCFPLSFALWKAIGELPPDIWILFQ